MDFNKKAEEIVSKMTVEEAAGQLQYNAPAIERLGIPAYNWWNEGIHGLARSGTATVFPQTVGLAAMFDRELVRRVGDITSSEARAKYNAYQQFGDTDIYKGLTLWAPNINIFRDPRWGRGHETYGEDPYLTAELGCAFVRGIQGDGEYLKEALNKGEALVSDARRSVTESVVKRFDQRFIKAAACVKHFAVHSGPESLRHEFDAVVSPKDLEETYLPAFEATVKAGAEGVMGAYNRVNGEPACASEYLMGKLDEWGFDGYFVSDCWAIRDFHEHHGVTANSVESAAMAIKAGCDLNCGCTYAYLLAALDEGLITEKEIRTACVHLMRTRLRLGLFEEHTEFDDTDYLTVSCPEHKALSLKCAERSMVLLENNGILPLDEDKLRTIAVIGPNAGSRAALEGNYCGTADRYVTFLEGIEDRFMGRVLYAEGCHLYKDRTSGLAQAGDRYAEAMAAAAAADISVLCLGLDPTIEGEEGDTGNEFSSGDKSDLRLPESQRILIEKIKSIGKPFIVVCSAGSSVNIECEPDGYIHAFYPGSEGGTALAEILFGDVSPSGKLPVTFYDTAEKLPPFTDYSMNDRTYRYARDNVLYPFGYGLTYGDIVCTGLEYRDNTAYVTAENRGDRSSEDVIQLYIRDYSEHAVPNVSLCGFLRISLESGEKRIYELPVEERAFTSVNDNGERKRFGDRFTLYATTKGAEELQCSTEIG